ncbi:Chitin synthase, class 7 [Cryptotrichosporon argae]
MQPRRTRFQSPVPSPGGASPSFPPAPYGGSGLDLTAPSPYHLSPNPPRGASLGASASPTMQPTYPPSPYRFDSGTGDISFGGGGKDQWVAGEEDDEMRPLTGPSAYDVRSALASPNPGADFIRRQTIPKRARTTKRVKLTGEGHWIQDHPVPNPVLSAVEEKWLAGKNTKEFSHMRYTAATCDPDDFTVANGWNLRVNEYGRETELLIAVTSYNEDKILYARTLHNVMVNIRDICNTKASKFWRRSAEEGRPGWQRITVALIADGIEPMDSSVLDVLATIGVYQDGIMKKAVDGDSTVAHIFEYTTQLSVDAKPDLVQPHPGDPNNLVPVQIIFVLKQENSKKINSHRWLFNAIGRMLKPEVCVLLDAGTKPGHKAVYHLWEAFYNNPNLGGACGEIHAMINKGVKLLNPLVAAQNFEYKMSNILDKPLESSFGYVSVLPGAFSAYRFHAIQGRPLEQYFHGDQTMAARLGKKGVNGMNIFIKNMFLAEDRILCFELVAKAKDRWTLAYVKPSKAETDVPEQAAELISQRRRWLNGSFAASVYSLYHFFQLYRSGHGPIRMIAFHFQAIYNAFSLIFSWFALANLWLTFSIIITMLPEQNVILFGTLDVTHWINKAAEWIYLVFLALQFILALGNRPKGEKGIYIFTLIVFAILTLYLLVCSVILSVKAFESALGISGSIGDKLSNLFNSTNGVLVASVMSTIGIYLFASLLYRDPWHMLSSFPQYMLLAGSFTNVLMVYAFCNLQDVSWGTKGSDKVEALPAVSSSKGKEGGGGEVEDVRRDMQELDASFQETVTRAVAPMKADTAKETPSQDDQNKTFRTRLVGFWILTNAALAISIQSLNGLDVTTKLVEACIPSSYNANNGSIIVAMNGTCIEDALVFENSQLQDKQQYYFRGLLWATFGLSAVRFVGCVYYWLTRQLGRCCRRN